MRKKIQQSPEALAADVKALFRFKAEPGVDPALVEQLKTAFDAAWGHVPPAGVEFIARSIKKPHTLILVRSDRPWEGWEYRDFSLGEHYSTCEVRYFTSDHKAQMRGALELLALIAIASIFRGNGEVLNFEALCDCDTVPGCDPCIMQKNLAEMWLTGSQPAGNKQRLTMMRKAIGELQKTIQLYTPEKA